MKPYLKSVFIACVLTTCGAVADDEQPTQPPDKYRVKFETTAGNFVLEVTRKWAPIGADHFYQLIQNEFYKDCRFFRVVPGFVVQFGINGDPQIQKKYKDATLQDEPVVASNMRGFITYAKSREPNSRTTQMFINLKDNQQLDGIGFSPFGRVVEGMDVVDKITAEYGEQAKQGRIQSQGNAYLTSQFPNMDYIKSATIVKDETPSSDDAN